MQSTILRLATLLAIVAYTASPAIAYLKKTWTPKELAKESGVIVIAKPVKTVETKDTINLLKDRGIDVELVKLETTFKISIVIKGDVECDKDIVVIHYKIKSINQLVIEGPLNFLEFRQDSISVVKDKLKKVVPAPEYMMYLKVQKDGSYMPVAGDFDAPDAIFEVNRPWSDSTSIHR